METIVIIGAGASGLACMNELVKTNKYNIIVLEQSNKAARKILASGNGRCNVSNLNMDIKYYNHQDPLIEKLIKEFDVVNFFKQLSLKLRYEKNLVYPYSLSSLSVKNVLMKNMDNVSYIDNCEVLAIKKAKTYEIITTNGHYQADKIVIATGSPASHLSGQNNLKMLEKMHISMIPFTPSLVQVKTKPVFKALKGQRVKGIAMLYDQNQLIEKQTGEIMFTDYGLSGICVMQLSRYLEHLKNPKLVLNLLPDIEKEELAESPYAPWSMLKPYCFNMIKGKRTPLSMKLVFSMPPHSIAAFLNKNDISINPDTVNGLYLNIRYENRQLCVITGTSLSSFTLDKSVENAWDTAVGQFIKKTQGL